MRSLIVALAAMLVPALAWAQTDPQAPSVDVQTQTIVVGEAQGEEASGRPDPDTEVICRIVQETGSRLARRRQRVCGTRTMWEQVADDAADIARGNGVNVRPNN